jgi:hypothetical protein
MKPDLVTRFIFNDSVIVELTSDYAGYVMVEVMNHNDPEDGGRTFQLSPDEIDLFISTLTLYKNRILNPKEKKEGC